jgi:hypothetical protein
MSNNVTKSTDIGPDSEHSKTKGDNVLNNSFTKNFISNDSL